MVPLCGGPANFGLLHLDLVHVHVLANAPEASLRRSSHAPLLALSQVAGKWRSLHEIQHDLVNIFKVNIDRGDGFPSSGQPRCPHMNPVQVVQEEPGFQVPVPLGQVL